MRHSHAVDHEKHLILNHLYIFDYNIRTELLHPVIGCDEPLSRHINLHLERGQKKSLVGANDIGKTNSSKAFLGIHRPYPENIGRENTSRSDTF